MSMLLSSCFTYAAVSVTRRADQACTLLSLQTLNSWPHVVHVSCVAGGNQAFSFLLQRNTPMMLFFSLWLQILQSWLYLVRANTVILFSHRSCRLVSCSSPANVAAPFAFDACQLRTCPLHEQTGAWCLLFLQTLQSRLHMVHANFVAGGHKRHRFRDSQLWQYDQPKYYDPERLFSFDMHTLDAPQDWLKLPTRARVHFHVRNIATQLEQVWVNLHRHWIKSQCHQPQAFNFFVDLHMLNTHQGKIAVPCTEHCHPASTGAGNVVRNNTSPSTVSRMSALTCTPLNPSRLMPSRLQLPTRPTVRLHVQNIVTQLERELSTFLRQSKTSCCTTILGVCFLLTCSPLMRLKTGSSHLFTFLGITLTLGTVIAVLGSSCSSSSPEQGSHFAHISVPL